MNQNHSSPKSSPQSPHESREDSPSSPDPSGSDQEEGLSTVAQVLIGCGIVTVLGLLLVAGAGVYFYYNWRSMASGLVAGQLRETIKQQKLPKDQEKKLLNRVDKLEKQFNKNELSASELNEIAKEIQKRPIFQIGSLRYIEAQMVNQAQLTQKEKENASRLLDRFERGLAEREIPISYFKKATKPIRRNDTEEAIQFKSNPSKKEIKAFLGNVREKVDEKNIPDEPYTYDLAEAIDRAIEAGLDENKK